MTSAILAIIAATLAQLPPATPGDSALAHRLTRAALDQQAVLNLDSALTLLRAARHADSTDIVAELRYVELRLRRLELGALRTEYAASIRHWSPRSAFCWTPWVRTNLDSRRALPDVMEAEHTLGPSPCTTAQLGFLSNDNYVSADVRLAMTRRTVRSFPDLKEPWLNYAELLQQGGHTAQSEAAWREGDRAVGHPLLRLHLAMSHVRVRIQRGDTVGARALGRELRSAVLRERKPGVTAEYLAGVIDLEGYWGEDPTEPHALDRLLSLTASANDWAITLRALTDRGKLLIDRGEPLRAIDMLTRAVAIADGLPSADWRLVAHTLRGRAHLKAAQFTAAEADLVAAVAVPKGAGSLYARSDAYHNLAHTYEAEGRWAEATRTVDRFIELALQMRPTGPEVTAWLDGGDIRWKAGWHAAAEVAYRQMVLASERTHDWYYAGQYYERSGNLERARSDYAHGAAESPAVPAFAAGLARVHEALGHADSAEVWARRHDAQIERWPPLEVPLLPDILVRRGRFAEATRVAHGWAARQATGGNAEGAAIATLQVARLLLDAGYADSAAVEASRGDSLASTSHLTREQIRARTIRGAAFIRLGKGELGVRAIRDVLDLADTHPSPDLLFEAHLALGDALAATRQASAALHEYDLAALAVERATLSITDDLDRAGFREQHLRPFNGALRLLLSSSARPRRDDDILRWQSRRNAAALAIGAAGQPHGAMSERGLPGLSDVQERLAGNEALVGYTVIDSTVTATVVTAMGMRIVRLPIGTADLGVRIAELRNPMVATYSGRIDFARVRYPARVAHDLYAALIAPFANELRGKTRLLIVPDGPLHSLSFDALVTNDSRSASAGAPAAEYLIDNYEVEYLPSPVFLFPRALRPRAVPLSAARVLAVGFDAPGSDAEIGALRRVWQRHELVTLEGGAATEHAVKARMASFGVLHFAAHAIADAHDPLASHLRLAADSVEDGYFHTNEIAAIRTSADLVVLSACETNSGPIYGAEGVMGIARAFLAGGAQAVIGTQWPIGAETAVLMKDFYVRLARGETPAAALRAAKLMVRRSSLTANPVHWAGFVLVR